MEPKYTNGNVVASCPICKVPTTFEAKTSGTGEFGSVIMESPQLRGWPTEIIPNHHRIVFRLLRCAACGRAAVAAISDSGQVVNGKLLEFLPRSIQTFELPVSTPQDIEKEFREAESDASIGNYRSGSAMLRSTLEKILKSHGYNEQRGGLEKKIDDAAADGIITLPLKRRAQENVRVLGNNILHDEWREVDQSEFEESHEYTRRVLECFFDDPETVRKILVEKGRFKEDTHSKGVESDKRVSKNV